MSRNMKSATREEYDIAWFLVFDKIDVNLSVQEHEISNTRGVRDCLVLVKMDVNFSLVIQLY